MSACVRPRKIISASLYTFDEFVYERHAEQKLMVLRTRDSTSLETATVRRIVKAAKTFCFILIG
jgi:hypothetical protein